MKAAFVLPEVQLESRRRLFPKHLRQLRTSTLLLNAQDINSPLSPPPSVIKHMAEECVAALLGLGEAKQQPIQAES